MGLHRHVFLGTTTLLVVAGCRQGADREGAPPSEPAAAPASARSPTPAEAPTMRDLDQGPPAHVTFRPTEVSWRDGPPSFEAGARFAVLDGDPGEAGVFTMQLRFPDGFVINPHWHPNVERFTVLRGTMHLGSGEVVDQTAAEALPVGTYTSMPKEMVHYAIAEGDTILQLTSVGPWEIHYVREQDDPRKRPEPRAAR
jgi:hypothetical protein